MQRPGGRVARGSSRSEPLLGNRQGIAVSVIALMLLAAFGVFFMMISRRDPVEALPAPQALSSPVSRGEGAAPPAADVPAVPVVPAAEASTFQCDGRTMCSQMTSCAEAEFFLANCPGTQMDGNHDGEPCEQQWCN